MSASRWVGTLALALAAGLVAAGVASAYTGLETETLLVSAHDVEEGSDVLYLGLKVGSVRHLEVRGDRVAALLLLDPRAEVCAGAPLIPHVRTDVLTLARHVSLEAPSTCAATAPLSEVGVAPREPDEDLELRPDEMLVLLRDLDPRAFMLDLRQATSDAAAVAGSAGELVQRLDAASAHSEALLERADSTLRRTDALVQDLGREARAVSASTGAVLENADRTLAHADAALGSVERSAQAVQGLSESVEGSLDQRAEDLDCLIWQLSRLSGTLPTDVLDYGLRIRLINGPARGELEAVPCPGSS